MRGQDLGVFRRSLHEMRSRRGILRSVIAGVFALAALPAGGYAFQDGGSISVQGFLCPSGEADLSDCQATDEIFAADFVITGPEGLVLTLDDGESHAVSHVWYGLPYGVYSLQAIGATPAGYALSGIRGATDDGGFGKQVVLDDDNPEAFLCLIYVPW